MYLLDDGVRGLGRHERTCRRGCSAPCALLSLGQLVARNGLEPCRAVFLAVAAVLARLRGLGLRLERACLDACAVCDLVQQIAALLRLTQQGLALLEQTVGFPRSARQGQRHRHPSRCGLPPDAPRSRSCGSCLQKTAGQPDCGNRRRSPACSDSCSFTFPPL